MPTKALLIPTTLLLASFAFAQTTAAPSGNTSPSATPQTNTPATAPCSCPCANAPAGTASQQNTAPSAAPISTQSTTSPAAGTGSATGTVLVGNNGIGSAPVSPASQENTQQSTPTAVYESGQTSTTGTQQSSTQNTQQMGAQTSQQPSAPVPQSTQSTTAPVQSTAPAAAGSSPQSTGTQSTGPVLGQRPEQPTRIPMARTVPVGTEMDITLDRGLSSKTSRPGDEFTATLAEPLSNQSGTVLIPAGSKIRGEVANAESGKILPQLRGKGSLALRFLDIRMPDGTAMPLQATLLSVHDTKGAKSGTARTDDEGQVTGGTSGRTVAKDVGIGAGIGTVAGLIFGSALKGLAIGAIAGGGYVLANAGKDVEIPDNAGMRLRLDQNLTVPATSSTGGTMQQQR